jgi:hypothetical protein
MRRVMMILASALLAGSPLATDAQARGGGGGGGELAAWQLAAASFGGGRTAASVEPHGWLRGAHIGGFGEVTWRACTESLWLWKTSSRWRRPYDYALLSLHSDTAGRTLAPTEWEPLRQADARFRGPTRAPPHLNLRQTVC